jgi:hypothetical protein
MKLRRLIFALVLALWAIPTYGQGCAMCASAATATNKNGQKAVGKGVAILLVPPAGFMTLGVWMAFRYGKKRDLESVPESTE